MDVAIASMQMSINSLQSATSLSLLDKAMNKDAQAMATLLNDMMPATPALPMRPGAMDIRA